MNESTPSDFPSLPHPDQARIDKTCDRFESELKAGVAQAVHDIKPDIALQQNREYKANQQSGAQRGKETLARYRGQTCGVRYAEALWAARKRPVEIL